MINNEKDGDVAHWLGTCCESSRVPIPSPQKKAVREETQNMPICPCQLRKGEARGAGKHLNSRGRRNS
jgi:hypothetical protein